MSDPNYHVEFNRVISKAVKRFMEKERQRCHGWDQSEWKGNMANRAYKKLKALANNESKAPLKDAADVMNYCVFFYVQHEKGEKDV